MLITNDLISVFDGILLPSQAVWLERGPLVYAVCSRRPIEYPKGLSNITYIGWTTTAPEYLPSHRHAEPGDLIAVIRLAPILRWLKDRPPYDWRRCKATTIEAAAKKCEASLMYYFESYFGTLPRENIRRERLTPENRVLLEFQRVLNDRATPARFEGLWYGADAPTPTPFCTVWNDPPPPASGRRRQGTPNRTKRSSGRMLARAILGAHGLRGVHTACDAKKRLVLVDNSAHTHLLRIKPFKSHCRASVRAYRNYRWLDAITVTDEDQRDQVVEILHEEWAA